MYKHDLQVFKFVSLGAVFSFLGMDLIAWEWKITGFTFVVFGVWFLLWAVAGTFIQIARS